MPRSLRALKVASGSVTLAWRPAPRRGAGKIQFEVFRDGRQIGSAHQALFTDTHVKPATVYRYAVMAVDVHHHRSRRTHALQVRTPAAAAAAVPPPPSGAGNVAGAPAVPAAGIPDAGPTGTPGAGPPPGASGISQAMVDRLFWRAGFGPTDAERATWTGRPLAELIDFLLGSPNTLQPTAQPPSNMGHPIDPLNSDPELVMEWLDRMQRSNNPLVERLTFFWHRHWAVARSAQISAASLLAYRNRLGRYADFAANPDASFRGLAREMTTQDAAMSIYLNGYQNKKAAPNENYAREFQELFCLGVTDAAGNPNYTQSDVHQMARAFTGYTLDPAAPDPVVTFNPALHDTGIKTIYGQSGDFDANGAVELVLSHPSHAPFLVSALWKEFIHAPLDAATLADLVATYTAGGQLLIAPVMRKILSHPAIFESLGEPNMLKPPVVFCVGVLRQLGAPLKDTWQTAALTSMQQLPYFPPNVAGWEGGLSWMNTTTSQARFDLIVRCQSLLPPVADVPGESAQQAVDRAYAGAGSPWLSDGTRLLLAEYAAQAPTTTAAQRLERQYALQAFMLGGPDGQVM
ncbi:MAG: hypothetical protein NVSMB51_14930 [Solirubrobacteraceae bacterium]